MNNRRKFIIDAAVSLLSTVPLAVHAATQSNDDEAARGTRTGTRTNGQRTNAPIKETPALQRELVHYATLAASSHNTQCWKFKLESQSITIVPDLTRRCPAVDPDDHHLFASLGCAAENLVLAAAANGLRAQVRVDAAGEGAVRIALDTAPPTRLPLFEAIPQRQCTRAEYDSKPVSVDDLKLLEQAGTGNGVRVLIFTDKSKMENVLEYVVQGNTAQMNDKAFVAELKAWVRFNETEARAKGDGLFAGASGNPIMPHALASVMFDTFFTANSENKKYTKQIRSSAGVAVFVSEASDKQHWVEAGRCYERFALQATALGIRNAFLNQPVEVGSIRPQFASFLGIGQQRPDLIVRFGRGPVMPRSLRRPIEAVIV
jgi:hypothetical protein